MDLVPAKAEDLQIGNFIKLTGSWFEHPFPTNSFKIKSEKELSILRGLQKTKIFYDPDRSNPPPEAKEELDPDSSQETQNEDAFRTAKNPHSSREGLQASGQRDQNLNSRN
jgi:hypothetical protein